ncbi:MAG: amidohydrolase family protein [Rhodobacteraceae bacterium]|nr:amidohydrolase family protein [Paracoccaceae bacterium]
MFDLIVKNATLPDSTRNIDIACADGIIVGLEHDITAESRETIDATGYLVSPPFVDPHFHMDATLSLGTPRMNTSGTLLEGIALWGELKPIQSVDDIIARALRYCDLAVSMGLGAIRSHVDVCDDTLKGVEALLEVRAQVAPYLDLQLVAFPQDGVLRDPTAMANLIRALDMGVDIVGGIPHFERTMQQGADSIRQLARIAADRGLMIDMHCDESDDPSSRHIETLALETQAHGLQGRVTGSHLTSMHSMDNYYVSKLIPLMTEAEINVIPNPLINIMLQGRHDTYPKRRGQTRVPELRDAGLTVGFGSDCVMDPWYSLGRADMLDVAAMGLHVGQLSSRKDMEWCFDAVTVNSAAIMGLKGYGLAKGNKANMVLLQARDRIEAIRLRAHRLATIRGGKIIARAAPVVSDLNLPGRPETVNPADYAPQTNQD